MIRKLSSFIIPVTILIAAWFTVPRIALFSPEKQELAGYAPYAFIALGMFLSLHFRRGRVFMALILFTLFYYLYSSCMVSDPDSPKSFLVYRAMALLLPFNLLLLTIMREKGIVTVPGRIRLIFIAFQFFILWITISMSSQTLWVELTKKLLQWPLLDRLNLPQESLILLLLAVSVTLVRIYFRSSPIEVGLCGAGIGAFIILNWIGVPDLPTVFSSAVALILVMAVIQDSHNMAFLDDLTGLPSRRSLNERLPGLGHRYAIAMVDIDHFKRFNDTYGHDVGDQVLRMVAGKLMDVTGGGQSFRYGGEEFTVLFSGKSAKDAAQHMDRMRQVIADYSVTIRGADRPKNDEKGKTRRAGRRADTEVSVTVSVGVAEAGPRTQSPDEVIKAADVALYCAKDKGRNQVCLAGRR